METRTPGAASGPGKRADRKASTAPRSDSTVDAARTGGLLAQAPDDPLAVACRGVVWHGMAADLLARDRGQMAVQVTQLLDYLPAALGRAGR